MKLKKEKISSKTMLYYVQKPDPMLVNLVHSHFKFENGSLAEQDSVRMIRKTSDVPREIYALKFQDEIYYIKKYYQFTLKQKIKILNQKLWRIKNLLRTPGAPFIYFDPSRLLFVLKNRKNSFNHECILVMNRNKDTSFK